MDLKGPHKLRHIHYLSLWIQMYCSQGKGYFLTPSFDFYCHRFISYFAFLFQKHFFLTLNKLASCRDFNSCSRTHLSCDFQMELLTFIIYINFSAPLDTKNNYLGEEKKAHKMMLWGQWALRKGDFTETVFPPYVNPYKSRPRT